MKSQMRTGNLKSALNNFDAEENDNAVVIEDHDSSGRDRILTFGSIIDVNGRDHSLTFGSEFDFSFPNADNFNSLLTTELNAAQTRRENLDDDHGDGVNPVSVDSELKSYNSGVETSGAISIKQSNTVIAKAATIHDVLKATGMTKPIIPTKSQGINIGTSGSGGSSNSGFLDGMFTQSRNQPMIAHTPPSAFGTSYEAQHFGKRMRAGSISGRLRSVSNLEDMDIIDQNQKSIIKDLIIAGDKDLLNALDNYDKGDTSELETLVKKGLQDKAQDIDLLDDLDLDFLTFNDGAVANSSNNVTASDGDSRSTSQSRKARQHRSSFTLVKNAIDGNTKEVGAPTSYEDDGIGELDFNDDYGELDALANSGTSNNVVTSDGATSISEPQNVHRIQNQSQSQPVQSNSSLSTLDAQQRCRSNTFSSLLGGTPPAESSDQSNFGRWMDGPVSIGSLEGLTSKFLMDADNLDLTEDLRNIIVTPEMEQSEDLHNNEDDTNVDTEIKPNRAKAKKTKGSTKDKKSKKKEGKSTKKDEKNKSKDSKNSSEPIPIVHGLGRPRSMSDPNLITSKDADGLLQVDRPEGWVGAYSPESRKIRIDRFMKKRNHRVWTKKVKYDVRKNFADSRLRVKGRFVKKEDELLMRDLLSLT